VSTWTAPATWSNGAVTAASMNVEIRDHLLFLKGAMDILTNSTTADTGTTMSLRVARAAASDAAYASLVTGDAANRWSMAVDGGMTWGSGAATRDVRIMRSSAGLLNIDANSEAADTQLRVGATAGRRAFISALVTGDSSSRMVLSGDGTSTGMELGSGAATRDVRLIRSSAGLLNADANSEAVDTQFRVAASAGQRSFISALVAGDSSSRMVLSGDGTLQGLELGPGSAARDVRASRFAAGELLVDANSTANATTLRVRSTAAQRSALTVDVAGDSSPRVALFGDATRVGIELGPGSGARDVIVERVAADVLGTTDVFEFTERGADPTAGAANTARFYARDNGSGKTQLVARFATGAIQVIATEP
jgi:hypothetical protein